MPVFGRLTHVFLLVLLLPIVIRAQSSSSSNGALQQIQFREVDTLFQNPGQGWFVEPYRQPRLPDSVVYLRFDWAQVEPKDGKYDWGLIDSAIEKAHKLRATLAMRVMTANAHSSTPYSSPKWLLDEGCKAFPYTNDGSDAAQGGKPIKRFEPDYADPIYLAKHGAFLRALGKRYNGDPNIEFVDIGSYGIWGEWHTTHPAAIAVRQQIIDMYLNTFDKTQLVYMSDDADLMSYALAHGTGLRRDGVGSPWHEARWAGTPAYANVPAMADAWKQAPIVFEWFLNYDYFVAHGWSFDSAVDFMLRNHVSMINDNLGPVPEDILPKLEMLARRAGYRFVLRDITIPAAVRPGDAIHIAMDWSNRGVAKLYRAYTVQLELRSARGDIVASSPIAADPRDWLPGDSAARGELSLPPAVPPGEYSLEVGIFDTAKVRPPLHLAIDAPENGGWYELGHVTVQ